MLKYQGFKDLIVYQKSFILAMDIFNITAPFPKEEKYSLTDQIRRSSRSIAANIAEAWPKRKYEKAFVLRLIDAQAEACETIHWLDISLNCKYISQEINEKLVAQTLEIQRMLESMIRNPEKFCH